MPTPPAPDSAPLHPSVLPTAPALHSAVWIAEDGASLPVEVTGDQLHGRACVHCGSTLDGLMDAGFLYVGPGGWRAKACPHHTGSEAAA